MLANKYFKENLEALKESKYIHKARAVYKDSSPAYKKSIYQVFEKYPAGQLPIHTYRETAVKSAIQEMLWIYKDQSNRLFDAHKRDIYWWDDFDIGGGTIGKRYGYTVRKYDQIGKLLNNMAKNPFSNDHMINLWQIKDLENKGLKPCAFMTQFNIIDCADYRLVNQHLQLRSSDYITAGAINRIQYYCLGMPICGHLTFTTGIPHYLNDFSVLTNDMHIYDRHLFAIDELLWNEVDINNNYEIKLSGAKSFYDYDIDDFQITRPKGLMKLSQPLEIAV